MHTPSHGFVCFPKGLIGFPAWQHFELKPGTPDGVVQLLQSLDDENVCFLVTDPTDLCPGYDCQLRLEDLEGLEAGSAHEVRLLCTLTLRDGDAPSVTANLLGPLAVNLRTELGVQVALDGQGYSARTPVATCERTEPACLVAQG